MPIGPNDVNILSVTEKNADADAPAGQPIELVVKAEVGETLFNSGAAYQVGLHVIDESVPARVFFVDQAGTYGDANWNTKPVKEFTYTMPGTSTTGRQTHILRLQAYVIGNKAGARDASHVASGSLLLTP